MFDTPQVLVPTDSVAGVLDLQAIVAERKVRDAGDNRINIYLLGVAHSAAGKDWPRKVNTRIVHEVGLAECFGERFASGDASLRASFSMLGDSERVAFGVPLSGYHLLSA